MFVSAVRFPHGKMGYNRATQQSAVVSPEKSIMWSLALIGLLVGATYGEMTLAVGFARL